MKIKKSIHEQLATIDLDAIQDHNIKSSFQTLFNIIEGQSTTIRQLQEENQKLRDENNRLKGEQGKPDIKPNKNTQGTDISSEKERKERNDKSTKRAKNSTIHIDRTKTCEVDKTHIPKDAIFKGYETVISQGIKITTDNVAFQIEIYYSPAERKTYRGQLPSGYEGGFSPELKALVLTLKNVCNMSESKIIEFLRNVDIDISAGTISNMLIKNKEPFHQEACDIFEAGLASTQYQQIDDTSARVNGQNYYTHVICNPLYTAYMTTKKKDRLTIIELLQNGIELTHCLNEEALDLCKTLGVPQKHLHALKVMNVDEEYHRDMFTQLLNNFLPSLKPYARTKIMEATAIASYHKGIGYQVVKILMCDDAPQFKLITEELALCWIHDGRHYKKLAPIIPQHIKELDVFLNSYWKHYHTLREYKKTPSKEAAKALLDAFDCLFSTQTGYQALDERIAKTKAKKAQMLLVLKYPELPLHNNESELGARAQVSKRDVSLHTITEEGTKANDTFLTITQTCKKLGVSAYEYISDRVSGSFRLPSLAQIIQERTHSCINLSTVP